MSELMLLRRLAPGAEVPTSASRDLALRRLRRAIRNERRSRALRRLTLPGVALAAAAAFAVVAVALIVGNRTATPAAAAVLTRAAEAARAKNNVLPLAPGQYLYIRSVDAYLSTKTDPPMYSVLVPHVSEIWLGTHRGRLFERSGTPVFLSDRDRRRWIADGRPKLAADHPSDMSIRTRPLDLPADPGAAYATLTAQARSKDSSFAWAMFQLIGDDLRETLATPAQRAALYAAAARVPGITLVGDVRDRLGRAGVAIGVENDAGWERFQLIVDPTTGDLLGEQEVVTAANPFGYPAGTVVGSATYVESGVVAGDHVRPKAPTAG